jgi:hypothetical protein
MKPVSNLHRDLNVALSGSQWHEAMALAGQLLAAEPANTELRFLLAELHVRTFGARAAANELRRLLNLALAQGRLWTAVAAQVALDHYRPGAGPDEFTRILRVVRKVHPELADDSWPVLSMEPDAFDAVCHELVYISLLTGESWTAQAETLVVPVAGRSGDGMESAKGMESWAAFMIEGEEGVGTIRPSGPASFLAMGPLAFKDISTRFPELAHPYAWSREESAAGSSLEAIAAASDPGGDRQEVMLAARCAFRDSKGLDTAIAGGQLVVIAERGCSFECPSLPPAFQSGDHKGTHVVIHVQLRSRQEPFSWQGVLTSVTPPTGPAHGWNCGIRWAELTRTQLSEILSLVSAHGSESASLWQLWNSSVEVKR